MTSESRGRAESQEPLFAQFASAFASECGALICGVDEAGRGPLAGPVYAAAVILDAAKPVAEIADSKVLPKAKREQLAVEIKALALAWAIAAASVAEIDRFNILQASLLAMRRAVNALAITPGHALIDGVHCPKLRIPMTAIVKGDSLVPAISAASILAKTARDAVMVALHRRFPCYGFDQHKGYATPEHLAALDRHGPCIAHRRSFAPVRVASQSLQLSLLEALE